jgi:hypothetical protein
VPLDIDDSRKRCQRRNEPRFSDFLNNLRYAR